MRGSWGEEEERDREEGERSRKEMDLYRKRRGRTAPSFCSTPQCKLVRKREIATAAWRRGTDSKFEPGVGWLRRAM